MSRKDRSKKDCNIQTLLNLNLSFKSHRLHQKVQIQFGGVDFHMISQTTEMILIPAIANFMQSYHYLCT